MQRLDILILVTRGFHPVLPAGLLMNFGVKAP